MRGTNGRFKPDEGPERKVGGWGWGGGTKRGGGGGGDPKSPKPEKQLVKTSTCLISCPEI